MVFVQPEQRVREQEIPHFVAPVVEDQRAPVRMRALARIGVLVKMRAVEFRQPVRVAREMRRRPVQNHAKSFVMAAIHEIHEIVRRAVTAGRREIADRLIAPRAVKRMLHDGHQLDVRVAHLL